MHLRIPSALLAGSILCACGIFVPAQTAKTFTIRILDGRTGKAITPTSIILRANHLKQEHPEWVALDDDGTGKVTLPEDTADILVRASYDSTMEIYINCDSVKDKGKPADRWYSLSAILATGVTAPNACSGKTTVAKPGELVVYVRPRNWLDRYQQDFSE